MLRDYVSIARYVVNNLYYECEKPKHLPSEYAILPQAGSNDGCKGHNNLLSILLVCGFRCFLSSVGAFGFIVSPKYNEPLYGSLLVAQI